MLNVPPEKVNKKACGCDVGDKSGELDVLLEKGKDKATTGEANLMFCL